MFDVYRNFPDPFIVIFSYAFDRDTIYVAGRIVDGPIELRVHAWDLDRFGNRVNLPFLVNLSLEGIPQHAWCQEIADKVLCDEAIIHFVDEDTERRVD